MVGEVFPLLFRILPIDIPESGNDHISHPPFGPLVSFDDFPDLPFWWVPCDRFRNRGSRYAENKPTNLFANPPTLNLPLSCETVKNAVYFQ